jgi:hypothetical protein
MTITLQLSEETQKRLQLAARSRGVGPAEYALEVLERGLSDQPVAGSNQAAASLLQSWIDQGNAEEQGKAYEYLTRVLDEDRPADRKLFPPELKGVSW